MVKIIETGLIRCGSREDISCYVCGQCVHEMDGFDIRQDLETHTIVVCDPCRLEGYPTRDEALMTAINAVYESWSETSLTQEDYWEAVQSKPHLFPETVDGMLGIHLWKRRGFGQLMATVYPCYYNDNNMQETDTVNPISTRIYKKYWRKNNE